MSPIRCHQQLYVFAQLPPSPIGCVCPIWCRTQSQAIRDAQALLHVTLTKINEERFTDGVREWGLFFGEKGMEEFGSLFDQIKPPRFPLGRTVITPAAIEAINSCNSSPANYLYRHERGDWGILDDDDRQANERAIQDGSRILSAYQLSDDTKIYVITEHDRSSTCVLLAEEY